MGGIVTYLKEGLPGKPSYRVEDVPDMSGKVIFITGGNSGIGFEIAKVCVFLSRNAQVYIASRSQERTMEAINKLKEETGKEALFIQLDVADLKSVRKAADETLSGVMNTPNGQVTVDGYDYQFGTNVIGHYLLTKRLLPLLRAAAQSSPDGKARIISSSSSAIHFTNKLSLDEMKDVAALKKLGSPEMYMQSKLANLVLSNEFARRYIDEGIVSVAVNPGNIMTGLSRHTPKLAVLMLRWLNYSVKYGILTGLYAGTTPEAGKLNGKYLIPWAVEGKMHPAAANSELGKRLWDWLDNETKD
ncbi:hypothetical protein Clacol_007047 [Clathrus columnatus]|uniref:NAD(P)-binding protein n=1 Tax=Clathrus columnatus TaxID=1419009 RepID=A0AAV5AGF7_9AGAM|nr:hypothetical protein Clacol_007047 [Clathrus columnatus]